MCEGLSHESGKLTTIWYEYDAISSAKLHSEHECWHPATPHCNPTWAGRIFQAPYEQLWHITVRYEYHTVYSSGKLHKDYTVYEDVKSILPIYIQVYPVRPCRDDLCEIIPSIWGAVARYDRSDLFIIACGQSHLFMNMLWSAMISCELTYHVATVLLVSCGGVFPHKNLVLSLSSKEYRHNTCI